MPDIDVLNSQQDEEFEIDGELPEEILAPEDFEIFSYPADNTLAVYHQLWKSGNLLLPKFQRGYVWKEHQASRLIESFLRGLPVPPVFLYMLKDTGKYLIIDGNQRMTSIISFLEGRFINIERENDSSQSKDEVYKDKIFKLKNVKDPRWNNKNFSNIDAKYKRQLQQSILRATIIKQLDDDVTRSIYEIFERLNTGGINLNYMEVRMCVSNGSFSEKLRELNKISLWRKLIKKNEPDSRVRDIEWILRSMALSDNVANYDSPMRTFLNDYMFQHKDEKKDWLNLKAKTFENALKIASKISETPFSISGRINLSVMDSMLVGFMSLNGKKIDEEKLKSIYNKIMTKPSRYLDDINAREGMARKENVRHRVGYVTKEFHKAIRG